MHNTTPCPHCHTNNKTSARFCNECGSALAKPAQAGAVTSPLQPVLAVHMTAPATAGEHKQQRWRGILAPAEQAAIAQHTAPAPQPEPAIAEVVSALTSSSFLISRPPPAARNSAALVPIWPDQPAAEPFRERKPARKPAPRPEPGAAPHPAQASTISTRYGLFGAGLALLVVAVAGVMLFSKIKTVTAPAMPAKPQSTAIEQLPPPDLTNGKGVLTLPSSALYQRKAQASQAAATTPKPASPQPQTKPVVAQAAEPQPAAVANKLQQALQSAETCMQQKKYDCAIEQARIAKKQAPDNGEAQRLLERAQEARQLALESINLE